MTCYHNVFLGDPTWTSSGYISFTSNNLILNNFLNNTILRVNKILMWHTTWCKSHKRKLSSSIATKNYPLKKCQNHEYMALKYQAYSKALKWKIEVEASIYNILFQNVLVPKPESWKFTFDLALTSMAKMNRSTQFLLLSSEDKQQKKKLLTKWTWEESLACFLSEPLWTLFRINIAVINSGTCYCWIAHRLVFMTLNVQIIYGINFRI